MMQPFLPLDPNIILTRFVLSVLEKATPPVPPCPAQGRGTGGVGLPRSPLAKGHVHVDWKIRGEILSIHVIAPKGVKIEFVSNYSHRECVDVAIEVEVTA
jgi:hypothetical protein